MGSSITSVTIREDASQLAVRFGFTPRVASLTNEKFELWTDGDPGTRVTDAFEVIDVYNDYNSISRVLTLNLKAELEPGRLYQLRTNGLLNAYGQIQTGDNDSFTAPAYVAPIAEPIPDIIVVDHSVKTDTTVDLSDADFMFASSSDLEIVASDPEDGATYVDTDHNNGRVTLTFSEAVNPTYLTSAYFKTQRKKIEKGFNRWETVKTVITQDPDRKEIYLDFPSNDATPVYYSDDGTYFEDQYKYRIRVLGQVSS